MKQASNIAVVYASKYGATQRYANHIAQSSGADLLDASKCNVRDLAPYDTIVFGGGIYSGGIKGLSLIVNHLGKQLANKRILVFAVGLTIEKEENRQQCLDINFGNKSEVTVGNAGDGKNSALGQFMVNIKTIFEGDPVEVPCYFFPGAFDPTKLKLMDRGIMKMTRNLMGNSSPDPDTQKIITAMAEGCDWVDLERTQELLDDLKNA